jgi:hypothetical protein
VEGDEDPLHGSVGAVDTPTLLIRGKCDRLDPVACAEEAARRLPDARLAVLPAYGHWPQREKPEAFLDSVLPFLSDRSGLLTIPSRREIGSGGSQPRLLRRRYLPSITPALGWLDLQAMHGAAGRRSQPAPSGPAVEGIHPLANPAAV